MIAINDGGPAFPTSHSPNYPQEIGGGLSIRDWFAGMALQGWLASYDCRSVHPVTNETELCVANHAYKMADAMLAARKEQA